MSSESTESTRSPMTDPSLQQEAEEAAARIGILRHDGRYPDFLAGYLAAAESRDQLIKKAFDEATSLLWLLSENDPNADMAARREAAEDFLAEHRPVNPNVTSIG